MRVARIVVGVRVHARGSSAVSIFVGHHCMRGRGVRVVGGYQGALIEALGRVMARTVENMGMGRYLVRGKPKLVLAELEKVDIVRIYRRVVVGEI